MSFPYPDHAPQYHAAYFVIAEVRRKVVADVLKTTAITEAIIQLCPPDANPQQTISESVMVTAVP